MNSNYLIETERCILQPLSKNESMKQLHCLLAMM